MTQFYDSVIDLKICVDTTEARLSNKCTNYQTLCGTLHQIDNNKTKSQNHTTHSYGDNLHLLVVN